MSTICTIVEKNLCLGCGLCEAVLGKDNVKMQLQADGFFTPFIMNSQIKQEGVIKRICPGVNIENDQLFNNQKKIWGELKGAFSGYSADTEIRNKGASGGVISAVAVYLLEKGTVDAILHVGGDSKDYKRNTLRVSKCRDDVLAYAASRYAPSAVFNDIKEILGSSEDSYLFVGKPCDISGLKNFLNEFPQYRTRFKFLISIICAGMPSFNATQNVIDSFKSVKNPITNLVYRGNGWPGFFSFTDASGSQKQMTYNQSWGDILGKRIHFRCKICPDGIGLQADMAVGDAWETKDGYPDFTEGEGHSLVLPRTQMAIELIHTMKAEKHIYLRSLPIEKLKDIQPYQYSRRRSVGARIIATMLVKQVPLNFRNMKVWVNLFSNPLKSTTREFGGTLKRLLKKSDVRQ